MKEISLSSSYYDALSPDEVMKALLSGDKETIFIHTFNSVRYNEDYLKDVESILAFINHYPGDKEKPIKYLLENLSSNTFLMPLKKDISKEEKKRFKNEMGFEYNEYIPMYIYLMFKLDGDSFNALFIDIDEYNHPLQKLATDYNNIAKSNHSFPIDENDRYKLKEYLLVNQMVYNLYKAPNKNLDKLYSYLKHHENLPYSFSMYNEIQDYEGLNLEKFPEKTNFNFIKMLSLKDPKFIEILFKTEYINTESKFNKWFHYLDSNFRQDEKYWIEIAKQFESLFIKEKSESESHNLKEELDEFKRNLVLKSYFNNDTKVPNAIAKGLGIKNIYKFIKGLKGINLNNYIIESTHSVKDIIAPNMLFDLKIDKNNEKELDISNLNSIYREYENDMNEKIEKLKKDGDFDYSIYTKSCSMSVIAEYLNISEIDLVDIFMKKPNASDLSKYDNYLYIYLVANGSYKLNSFVNVTYQDMFPALKDDIYIDTAPLDVNLNRFAVFKEQFESIFLMPLHEDDVKILRGRNPQSKGSTVLEYWLNDSHPQLYSVSNSGYMIVMKYLNTINSLLTNNLTSTQECEVGEHADFFLRLLKESFNCKSIVDKGFYEKTYVENFTNLINGLLDFVTKSNFFSKSEIDEVISSLDSSQVYDIYYKGKDSLCLSKYTNEESVEKFQSIIRPLMSRVEEMTINLGINNKVLAKEIKLKF
jgi:hypothetical protein